MPLHSSLYQQESRLDFRYRADVVLPRIVAENDENAVVVLVSHGCMINQLWHSFLRLPLDSKLVVHTGDAGFHEWRIEAGIRRVVYANRMVPLVQGQE